MIQSAAMLTFVGPLCFAWRFPVLASLLWLVLIYAFGGFMMDHPELDPNLGYATVGCCYASIGG